MLRTATLKKRTNDIQQSGLKGREVMHECNMYLIYRWCYVVLSLSNILLYINVIFLLCFRSVSGVDVDPDLVHMEMQDTSGGRMMFDSLFYH